MPVTSNPATLLKLTGKGRIQEGYDSDLVIINEDLSINTVICKGKIMIEGSPAEIMEQTQTRTLREAFGRLYMGR